ncbi:hypothetical protein CALVIDRAFT_537026 [Calocera viscosa TUFC12733]|uniref:T6SS Phospholipase effector Tle1-like catalytic domain-containing protein n=1 Tax=Calocera viscosa (strain TUFC12733) TaxID=1330018 RepID=A0A167MFY3_CALVF|nr:hypothetical protein CALVIDRAFT_537026 [Calocera viscosa TUFC12733]
MTALASSAINGDLASSTLPSDPSQSLPSRPTRNLIICIDGSGDHYGPADSNTNVVKLFMLLKQTTAEQVCYYQPGIGAGEANGVNALGTAIQKRLDFTIGTHLEVQVTDAYKWLMDTYADGDRIYMFGFSRGSYISRALAGMLQRVGLLGAGNFHNVPFAYRLFSKPRTALNDQIARGFKLTFCRTVHVEFIGVFDTVDSVGLLIPQTLPFTSGNTHIKTFRHAVSIDERRARFQDNLWSGDLHEEESLYAADGQIAVVTPHEHVFKTDILEVWFPGTHSDIGGGWPDDPQPSEAALVPPPSTGQDQDQDGPFADQQQDQGPCNLSVLPLRWMVREALAAGVLMKDTPLATLRHESDLDPVAACSTLHNTLPFGSFWWVLEVLPTVTTSRSSTSRQEYGVALHLGRARVIPEGARLHRSVQVRKERVGYEPAGGWPKEFEYVD